MFSPAVRAAILTGKLGWLDPFAPIFQIDLAYGRVWMQGKAFYGPSALARVLTTFSTPTHYSLGLDGQLYLIPANTLDYTAMPAGACRGQLLEEARTNVVLYSRDLTAGAWTASNITTAKDQVGPDGVANSASRITATADNATILQGTTLASSARFLTAYLRRLAGSGLVYMTLNGGATWTAVTVSSLWSRVSIPSLTLANPSVGFKLATSGDAIAVDLVDNENGAFATSPIATADAAVLRAASAAQLSPALSGITLQGPLAAKVVATYPVLTGSNFIFRVRKDGTNNWGCGVNASGLASYQVSSNAGGPPPWNAVDGAISLMTPVKQTLAVAGPGISDAIGTISTLSTTIASAAYTTFNPTGAGTISLSGSADAYTQSISFWPSRLPDAALLALVQ